MARVKTYRTTKGRIITTRPYAAIPEAERREILIELMTMPGRDIKKRHNIATDVLSHLKYHQKHLLIGYKTPQDRVQELKVQGLSSGEVAEITGIPLEKVNALWSVSSLRYI